MLDGVGDGFLRDAVEAELDVVRQPLLSVVAEVDVDLRCGPHLADKRLERGREPEVVDDRQAEVGADRPQPVDRSTQGGGGVVLARAVESVNEHREVLDHVVVDVRGDPSPLRLALVHHQAAVARLPGGLAGDGQDRDDPGDAHDGDPDDERLEERRGRERRERGERDRRQRRENGDVAGAEHGRKPARAGHAAGVTPELRREDERRHERHRRGEGPAQDRYDAALHPRGDRRRADEGGGQGKDRRAQHRPAPGPRRGDELGEGHSRDKDGSGHEHARQDDEERDQREVRRQQEQRRGRGGEEWRLNAQGRPSGKSAVAEPEEAPEAEQTRRDERRNALLEADERPVGLEDLRPEVVRPERRRQLARLGHEDQPRHHLEGVPLSLRCSGQRVDLPIDAGPGRTPSRSGRSSPGSTPSCEARPPRRTAATISICLPASSWEKPYVNPGSTTPAAYAAMPATADAARIASARIVSRIDVMTGR